jgi:hypothetical protein
MSLQTIPSNLEQMASEIISRINCMLTLGPAILQEIIQYYFGYRVLCKQPLMIRARIFWMGLSLSIQVAERGVTRLKVGRAAMAFVTQSTILDSAIVALVRSAGLKYPNRDFLFSLKSSNIGIMTREPHMSPTKLPPDCLFRWQKVTNIYPLYRYFYQFELQQ